MGLRRNVLAYHLGMLKKNSSKNCFGCLGILRDAKFFEHVFKFSRQNPVFFRPKSLFFLILLGYDPEGWYGNGIVDLPEQTSEIRKSVSTAVRMVNKKRTLNPSGGDCEDRAANYVYGKKCEPSYVWINPPPGPEDLV